MVQSQSFKYSVQGAMVFVSPLWYFKWLYWTIDSTYVWCAIYLDSINFVPLGSKYRNDTSLAESMYKVWHLNFISLRNFWDATFIKEKKHFFDFNAPIKKEHLLEAETFKDLFYKTESGEYILIYIHHSRGT